jgi:hypothetical protein
MIALIVQFHKRTWTAAVYSSRKEGSSEAQVPSTREFFRRLTVKKKAKKDEQTSRRPKKHDRGEDVMGFICRPLSSTAQGASNIR